MFQYANEGCNVGILVHWSLQVIRVRIHFSSFCKRLRVKIGIKKRSAQKHKSKALYNRGLCKGSNFCQLKNILTDKCLGIHIHKCQTRGIFMSRNNSNSCIYKCDTIQTKIDNNFYIFNYLSSHTFLPIQKCK